MWAIVYEKSEDKRKTGEEVLQQGAGDQRVEGKSFFFWGGGGGGGGK